MIDSNVFNQSANSPAMRAAWNKVSRMERDIVSKRYDIVPKPLSKLTQLLNALPEVLFFNIQMQPPVVSAMGWTTVKVTWSGITTDTFDTAKFDQLVTRFNTVLEKGWVIFLPNNAVCKDNRKPFVDLEIQYSFLNDEDEPAIIESLEKCVQYALPSDKVTCVVKEGRSLDLVFNRPFGIDKAVVVRNRGDRIYLSYRNPLLRLMNWMGVVGV